MPMPTGEEGDELDRRANRLFLKPLGREKYEEARQIAVALQTEILEALEEGKREEFLRNLAAVADSCRAAAEQSPRKSKSKL